MYQVVFTGRLLKGADRATVESELQRLFKANATQVEWFLRGKPIVVKSCDDALVAGRYYEALAKAGLECELRSDQPASAPVASPPEAHAAPREQLPIPGVDAAPPKAAPAPRVHADRRAPTLGPVTQAITAQDRAAVFVAAETTDRATPVAPAYAIQSRATQRLRYGASLLFMVMGAILVGTLAYFVRQEWRAREPPPVPITQTQAPPAAPKPVPLDASLEKQLIGRWLCLESTSGRRVENQFTPDGRYYSITYGDPDALQVADRMDLVIEGEYRVEGSSISIHITTVPSRAQLGRSVSANDYLQAEVKKITPTTLAWTLSRMGNYNEACLRAAAEFVESG